MKLKLEDVVYGSLSNQLWLLDIKYGCVHGEDRHFYFLAFVDSLELSHDFTQIRCPDKNAFVESFFSIFEIDFLQVRYFLSLKEVHHQVRD